MKKPILTIVVPCYNEEEVLPETMKRLSDVLDGLKLERLIAGASKLLFVDDGSKDRTWEIIAEENRRLPHVTGLKLSRNVGHQKALCAGLDKAAAYSDCVISIDADLQDDVRVIREFVLRYLEGYDVVYGVRASRQTDTWFKRNSATAFYGLMNKLGIPLVPHHADFRLLSKRAVCELCRYRESNLFLRGIVPLVGFASTAVYYDRKERAAGTSKYPIRKMLSFAFDGIASFSIAPIRWVTLTGMAILMVSIAAGLYAFVQKLIGNTHAGWTSLMMSIWFLGGLQLMGIGLIGEYIGKIYVEVKRRPKYIIETDLYTAMFERQKPRSSRMLQGSLR